MERVEFGSLDEANDVRDKVGQYLAAGDTRRSKTVNLVGSTPDSLVERVEQDAFESTRETGRGAGKRQLTEKEKTQLRRTHGNFSWQDHGFEAMAVKGAMEAEGVTEWQDFYEPGEGTGSALSKLREKKNRAQGTRAATGIGGDRADTAEMNNRARRGRQSERVRANQTMQAKEAALVGLDKEAIGFLQEEQQFGDGDLFDIRVTGQGPGLEASGADMDLLEQRNQQRSKKARRQDNLRAAELTNNPLEWSRNPDEFDFPGIDTLQPEKKHATRSSRAQELDNQEAAPIADSRREWAANPDQLDWPGVDTPSANDIELPTADSISKARPDSIPLDPATPEEIERDLTEGHLGATDVSLGPEEAFDGVGATSKRELGGFDPNVGGEVRPGDELDDIF